METSTAEPDLDNEISKRFLALEKIDQNIYRATNLSKFRGGVRAFGGQIIGQALTAATNTVSDEHHIHSLHAYFLRGGNVNKPVLYHIDRTRDGNTYSSRSVKATQDGLAIFSMQSSFKKDEANIFHHQYKMPDVPTPDKLLSAEDIIQLLIEGDTLTPQQKEKVQASLDEYYRVIPIEMRPVDPNSLFRVSPKSPKRHIWIRTVGHIGDDLNMHRCVLSYMSDLFFLSVSLLPAGKSIKSLKMASLDHSMWFHNEVRANEWILFEMESPQCGSGRAIVFGRFWKQDGTLAVSLSQEGMVRPKL